MKILGIDDNTDINELLSAVIKSEGHDFIQVTDGRKGVDLIREQKFDVVLFDISMPEFSGLDVIDALNEEGLMKKQLIVLLTASAITDAEVQEFVDKGIHSCMRKPLSVEKLFEELNKISEQLNQIQINNLTKVKL